MRTEAEVRRALGILESDFPNVADRDERIALRASIDALRHVLGLPCELTKGMAGIDTVDRAQRQ